MEIRVIIDEVAFSIQKIGGISVVWYELIKRMIKDKRFNTSFLEFENAGENYYRKRLDIPRESIRQMFSQKMFRFLRYINPKVGIREPFIFHSSYYRVARDKSAINVTTVHDFVYERCGDNLIRNRIHKWQQKRAVYKSNKVVCISESTKRDLLYFYKEFDTNKLAVIYNGVSECYFPIGDISSVDLPYPLNSYFLFVGARKEYKNAKLAIDSVAKTNANLVFVGAPLMDEEIAYLNQKIGDGRYCCLSMVSEERLNQLYNGAFALLYLSSYEGFGIPCIEAQKAGCPVIAYNSSSIPEVVCDKRLLIDVLSEDEVLEKVNLLKNERERERIINNGLKFSGSFTWDRTYKEYAQLYEELLTNHS